MHDVKIFTVGEVVGRIQGLLTSDPLLSHFWMRGEISNFRAPQSGHWYFTLKDKASSLRCVMFRSRANRTSFLPQEGMRVLIRGYVSLYERDGTLQVYVEELQADGIGALWVAFQELKEKLAARGWFSTARKRALPFFPRVIGIVTSPTGAAFQDLRSVIQRRCPCTRLVLAPATVQGQEAPGEIAAAIHALNQHPDVEVIIVGRGGGSLEELWAFNTEVVAQAIFASRLPVVSAVGHETDYCISDWVADCRAATPSAAAELVVPVRAELALGLVLLKDRLKQGMEIYLKKQRAEVERYAQRSVLQSPRGFLDLRKQEVSRLQAHLLSYMQKITQHKGLQLKGLADQLTALSPLAVLGRGYAICRKTATKEVIRAADQVSKGEALEVLLHKGSFDCRVEAVSHGLKGHKSLAVEGKEKLKD